MLITTSHNFRHINIVHNGAEDFIQVESDLNKINEFPTGRKLIAKIMDKTVNGKSLLIMINNQPSSSTLPVLTEKQKKRYNITSNKYDIEHNAKAIKLTHKRFGFLPNEGTSVMLEYNPNIAVTTDKNGVPSVVIDRKEAFICLAHELIHAYKIMKGTNLGRSMDPSSKDYESYRDELKTIGLGKYQSHRFTENNIRKEQGLNPRNEYYLKPENVKI